jgi:PIN domain nuclease of toxin-antitoxin system
MLSVTAQNSEPSPLLIDTHIWLWLMEGSPELKLGARTLIDEAVATGRLHLSIMSVWEIAMLSSRGRIRLSRPLQIWIDESLADPGPVIEPINPVIALASCQLPAAFRSDPADEMIVATTRIIGATLMTRDRRILDYAAAGHLNAVAA